MILFLKLSAIVAALVVFLRLKLNLSLSIFFCILTTVLLFRIQPWLALKSAFDILIDSKTLQLFVIILMVLYIGSILKSKGMIDKLIRSLNAMVGDKRIVSMIGPSIIGFLPSPGGALLSAPLVEISTREMRMQPEFKTFLNFWFRHFWEFIWPVYAGLLFFQTMSNIPLKKIILLQSPYTVLNIITGLAVTFYYFKKHNITRETTEKSVSAARGIGDFFEGLWPIILIILLFFLFSVPLYISLSITAIILTAVVRVHPREIVKILFSKFILSTMVLIAVVVVFQKIITISDIYATLKTFNVAPGMVVLIAFFISFIMGFLTGVNTAYIVIAYPILFPLIEHLPNFINMSIYIYVIGFAGILFSPLHLCLVLTNQYFKSSLIKVFKYLAIPVAVLVIFSTLVVLLT